MFIFLITKLLSLPVMGRQGLILLNIMKSTVRCRKMTAICRRYAISLALCIVSLPLQAQENKTLCTEANIDMVSQNVWRGVYQAGVSIQPSLTVTRGGIELFVWGTSGINSEQHEIDISLSYKFHGATVGLTDYMGGRSIGLRSQLHMLELNAGYEFDAFPLSLKWNSIVSGEQSRSFSSYVEIGYAIETATLDLNLCAGFTPWKNEMLETKRFAFTTLSADAGKLYNFNSRMAIRPSCVLTYNPSDDRIYFIAGVGLSFK